MGELLLAAGAFGTVVMIFMAVCVALLACILIAVCMRNVGRVGSSVADDFRERPFGILSRPKPHRGAALRDRLACTGRNGAMRKA